MIKESFFKHFLVKPCAVKADCNRKLDVIFERFICGSGVNAVGIEALVKNKALEHGFAVNEEFIIIKLNVAKPEIALDLILTKGQLKVIKSAAANLPKMNFIKLNFTRNC